MAFNSWDFFVFFAATYLVMGRRRPQNALLLAASYYFYSVWDWRFLSLILISTVVDFIAGRRIASAKDPTQRRRWLTLSMLVNLGILAFFKYCNFFVESAEPLLEALGTNAQDLHLHIVLPVGISFYTFQTMSYTIDIYRGELEATDDFWDFALFVAFFPQLVAGPIERARTLLPQIAKPREITEERLRDGFWLMAWGLWKKVVVADNMAAIVDPVFADSASATAGEAYFAVLAFALQIYCDFSGYSDIARGCARVLGFDLMLNFRLPYFARNPSDFWRRWHISLSTWLRDYLYIGLGGNRRGEWFTYRNLLFTMILGGLWHGASLNFVWWGLFHGLILIGHRWWTDGKKPDGSGMPGWLAGLIMFQFTLFGWLLFRATRRVSVEGGGTRDDSLSQLVEMLSSPANGLGLAAAGELFLRILIVSWPLVLMQIAQFRSGELDVLLKSPRLVRVLAFAVLILTWLLLGVQSGASFIYFQF